MLMSSTGAIRRHFNIKNSNKKQWSAAYNEKIFSLITTVINHCILIFIIYLITSHLLSVNNICHLLITNNIKTGILSFFIIILFNTDKSLFFLLTTGITAVTALACTFFAKASYRKYYNGKYYQHYYNITNSYIL